VAERIEASARIVGPALGYFVGALVSIATYRPQPMRLRIDGQESEGRRLVVVAANGTHFGSGMYVAPKAKIDDGLFDIVVAGALAHGAHAPGRAHGARAVTTDARRRLPSVDAVVRAAGDLALPRDRFVRAVRDVLSEARAAGATLSESAAADAARHRLRDRDR